MLIFWDVYTAYFEREVFCGQGSEDYTEALNIKFIANYKLGNKSQPIQILQDKLLEIYEKSYLIKCNIGKSENLLWKNWLHHFKHDELWNHKAIHNAILFHCINLIPMQLEKIYFKSE